MRRIWGLKLTIKFKLYPISQASFEGRILGFFIIEHFNYLTKRNEYQGSASVAKKSFFSFLLTFWFCFRWKESVNVSLLINLNTPIIYSRSLRSNLYVFYFLLAFSWWWRSKFVNSIRWLVFRIFRKDYG